MTIHDSYGKMCHHRHYPPHLPVGHFQHCYIYTQTNDVISLLRSQLMTSLKSFKEGIEMKFELADSNVVQELPPGLTCLPDKLHLPCLFVYIGSSTAIIEVGPSTLIRMYRLYVSTRSVLYLTCYSFMGCHTV